MDGTWYGYYWGINTETNEIFNNGLATSTDGIHWTKSAGNPIAAFGGGQTLIDGTGWNGSAALCFAKVNGTYYAWGQGTATSLSTSPFIPSDIMRWSAPTPSGPWTPLNSFTFYRTLASEGVGSNSGQVADPSILEVSGKCYLFCTASNDGDGSHYTVNLAIADMTLAQLVQTYEGVQNVPIPGSLSLNCAVLGSDTFQRVDANPIGGNWSQHYNGASFCAGKLASNLYQCAVIGKNGDSYWNAASFPNDQWSRITVGSVSNGGSYLGVGLREDSADANTLYRFAWGAANTGSTGTWYMQKYVANSYTTIATNTRVLTAGDTLAACIIGTNIYIYQDEVLIFVFSDSSIASGSAGVYASGAVATNTATVSAWSGGGFQNAPPIPPYPAGGFLPPFGAGSTGTLGEAASPSAASNRTSEFGTGRHGNHRIIRLFFP